MNKYEQLDISGDAGLKIRGKNLEELFENAAEGMSYLITDPSRINETETKEVLLSSDNIENLFVQWLNELIFFFDTYGFIGKRFVIEIHNNPSLPPHPSLSKEGQGGVKGENIGNPPLKKGDKGGFSDKKLYSIQLKAKVSGGMFNPGVNESKLLIKAATYHGLSIKKIDSTYEATVIFDI